MKKTAEFAVAEAVKNLKTTSGRVSCLNQRTFTCSPTVHTVNCVCTIITDFKKDKGTKMIDVETINEKCLIALQALQDVRSEIMEFLPTEFHSYLRRIKAENTTSQVKYFFTDCNKLVQQKPAGMFVTNTIDADEFVPEDLWFFFEHQYIKVKDFMEGRELDRIERIPIRNEEAQCMYFTKKNFSFQTLAPASPYEPSQFNITIRLENNQVLEFNARGKINCIELFVAYRKHLERLFPI